jgi:hypothetical protein
VLPELLAVFDEEEEPDCEHEDDEPSELVNLTMSFP